VLEIIWQCYAAMQHNIALQGEKWLWSDSKVQFRKKLIWRNNCIDKKTIVS
jgi:hypothetical protein